MVKVKCPICCLEYPEHETREGFCMGCYHEHKIGSKKMLTCEAVKVAKMAINQGRACSFAGVKHAKPSLGRYDRARY